MYYSIVGIYYYMFKTNLYFVYLCFDSIICEYTENKINHIILRHVVPFKTS